LPAILKCFALRDFLTTRHFDRRPADPRRLAAVDELQFFMMLDHGIWINDENTYIPDREIGHQNT
jgi:hypothetical protein